MPDDERDDVPEVRRRHEPSGRQARVHPVTKEEAARMTVAMDGVIEEVVACPNCGRIESRGAARGANGAGSPGAFGVARERDERRRSRHLPAATV
jgi:hypothetical protein